MIPDVTRLHLRAFEGYMNAQLGPIYAAAFLRWYCRHDEAIALMAVLDGDVAGYVVGAPEGYAGASTRALLPAGALAMLTRPWLLLSGRIWNGIWSRLKGMVGHKEMGRAPFHPSKTILALVAIGVAPEAQGYGVGRALMQAFERCARRQGVQALSLDVFKENRAARRLYESCGWIQVREAGQALRYEKMLRAPAGPEEIEAA